MKNSHVGVALLVCVWLGGCADRGGSDSPSEQSQLCIAPNISLDFSGSPSGGATLWVSTVDHFFSAGALKKISLSEGSVDSRNLPVSADAIVREGSGRYLFIVNRLGTDSIQVVDQLSFKTVVEFSVGRGTNAQDIAVFNNKAYITRHNAKDILVCDLNPIGFNKLIDVSPWADKDGIPEMSWMEKEGAHLRVLLQRLDSTDQYLAKGVGAVLTLNMERDEVEGVKKLTGKNPNTPFRSNGRGQTYVSSLGVWGVNDGGIEELDAGLVVSESQLGGEAIDFVLTDDARGVALVSTAENHTALVSFDLSTRSTEMLSVSSTPSYQGWSQLFAIPGTKNVAIADRSLKDSAVRVWNTAERKFERAIEVGLPPYSIGFGSGS